MRLLRRKNCSLCPDAGPEYLLGCHVQILKDAGIVKSRKEGTCIYYYLDPEAGQLNNLITLFCDIREFMKYVPDRSGNDT